MASNTTHVDDQTSASSTQNSNSDASMPSSTGMTFKSSIPSKIITKEEILYRKGILEDAAKTLKEEFIGLDHIIDEILSLISPWFIFPESQMRPTIVNCWGMTGTGKSAMIKRLVDLIGFSSRFIYLDMGEHHSGNSGSWLKNTFTYNLSFYHEKEIVLCMDEFQFARTLNENGEEVSRSELRIIWDLLDSGRILHSLNISNYYTKRALKACLLLEKCNEKGVEIEGGRIIKNLHVFQNIFKNFVFSYTFDDEETDSKTLHNEDYFISDDFASGLMNLIGDKGIFEHRSELIAEIAKQDIAGIQQLIMYCIEQETSMQELNFSRALIFNIGNLDEAFYMSKNMNPDISADDFYKEAKKVNISDIKTALQNRFRNEQIARMGNNHLIYPAFSQETYKRFIGKELQRICTYVEENFSLHIHFTDSTHNLLYQEGVYPTQGARPVLTTIKNQVESHISTILCHWLENDLDIERIDWSYANEHYAISFVTSEGTTVDTIQIPIRLKVNSLRKSKNDDAQAHTAVHEAGHAVLAAMTLRILPTTVVTRTASADAQGFCQINFPEDVRTFDVLHKDIMISLGGYLAEKMIFGKEHISTGASHDILHATVQANAAVREFGMLDVPMRISVKGIETNNHFFYEERYGRQAKELMRTCMEDAEKVLQENKRFLLEMARYLTENSRMNSEQIKTMAEQFSTEEWVRTDGFIQKNEYFQFKQNILDAITELEAQEKMEKVA